MPSGQFDTMTEYSELFAASGESDPPYLRFDVEPVNKIRFRYRSEKGSHGCLIGKTDSKKKTHPTIKLENYVREEPINIKVSLFTEDMRTKHVLELASKNCQDGECIMKLGKDCTAKFPSLAILNKTKSDVNDILMSRKTKHLSASEKKKMEKKLKTEIQDELKSINMNSARLCFEAYSESNPNMLICPKLFSETIYNQKSTVSSDLKIHRLSKCSGSFQGGEEVILLCDKVKKEDIQIRFYEKDEDDVIQWEDTGNFTKADVHYQYAITFRTPPYTGKITGEVKTFIELIRPSDDAHSEPREFTYFPSDYDVQEISRKRRKLNSFPEMPVSSILFSTSEASKDSSASAWSPEEFAEKPSYLHFNDVNSQLHLSHVKAPAPENTSSNNIMDLSDLELSDSVNDLFPQLDDTNFSIFDIDPPIWKCFQEAIEPARLDADTRIAEPQMGNGEDQLSIGLAKFLLRRKNNDACFTCDEDRLSQTVNASKSISKIEYLRNALESIVIDNDIQPLLHYMQYLIPMQDEGGNTLLHLAVQHQNKNLYLIQKILKVTSKNAINLQNKLKATATHLAVCQNKCNVLRLLLDCGGNPNIKDHEGNSCLHIAARNNHVECMKVLIPKPDSLNRSIPDLDMLNFQGLSALHLAIIYNSEECIDLLLRAKANINVKDGKCGRTPLHFAVDLRPSILPILLSQPNVAVNAQDFAGCTPLHLAYAKDLIDVVDNLMQAGANPVKNSELVDECEAVSGCTSVDYDPDNTEKIFELSSSEDEVSREYTRSNDSSTTFIEGKPNIEEEAESLDSNNLSGITFINDATVKRLCHLMDPPSSEWEILGIYLGIEPKECEVISQLDSSPTKALLKYLERNFGETSVERLKCMLEMADLSSALKIIQEHNL